MARWIICLLFMALLVVWAAAEDQMDGKLQQDIKDSAQEFLKQLVSEDFTRAVNRFDAAMKSALPADKLKDAWKSLTDTFGLFKEQAAVKTVKEQGFDIVVIGCRFEKGDIDVKMVFNSSGAITGLWFSPTQQAAEYRAPGYVDQAKFIERPVTIGSGEWALPGTLILPKGVGPFPGVVLVHGSGPMDRDETIGPNKPFKDLAWGLASQGIAVLRYEKRTRQYGTKISSSAQNMTVKEETIDDALSAVALMRQSEGVDSNRVFVLGHSLGGMLIPRIGKADKTISGFIIAEGTARPLEDVIVEQTQYLFSLKNELSEDDKKALELIKKQAAKVKDQKLSVTTPLDELPFGIPAGYWLDLRDYRPAEAAKSLQQPILIIQGGRDYQVTLADFQEWKDALGSRHNVTFKLYPKLNHLLIEGSDKSTPKEYQTPGHVSSEVVRDVADWVKRH